jgi:Type II secretion system (T2SS), protein E, N-terminal domain
MQTTEKRAATDRPPTVKSLLRSRRRLGERLVAERLITDAQLRQALEIQRDLLRPMPLGQILVYWKMLSRQQLRMFLNKHQEETSRLGDVLVAAGAITDAQLHVARAHQSERGLRLGDALLYLNLTTEEQLTRVLCDELEVRFVDLDTLAIDPALMQVIPLRVARENRIIPVALVEHRLTVAMEDPTDLGVVAELQAASGYTIEVVASTRGAFHRALERFADPDRDPAPAACVRSASGRGESQ